MPNPFANLLEFRVTGWFMERPSRQAAHDAIDVKDWRPVIASQLTMMLEVIMSRNECPEPHIVFQLRRMNQQIGNGNNGCAQECRSFVSAHHCDPNYNRNHVRKLWQRTGSEKIRLHLHRKHAGFPGHTRYSATDTALAELGSTIVLKR